jgi:pentatricopeptide repeat protein
LGTSEALNLVKKISAEIPKSFYSDHRLVTSLLNALMKCRDVTHAEAVFDQSTEKVASMYGVMIKGDHAVILIRTLNSRFFFQVLLQMI